MLRLLLPVLIVSFVTDANAQSAPSVALLVDGGRGKPAQVVKQAMDSIVSSEARAILRSAVLKKKLRGNPTKHVRRCKQNASCLAGLGKKVGADFVLLATVVKSEAVLIVVSVADAKELDNSTVAPIARDSIAGNAEAMIVAAVARYSAEPRSAEDIAAAELAAAVEAAALPVEAVGETTAEAPPQAGPEEPVGGLPLAPLTPEPAAATVLHPEPAVEATAPGPTGLLGYRMSWRTWAGAGGVVLGVTGLVVGKSLRGRADDLRDLPLRATQIEVVEQEKSQNRAAIGSTVSYTLGAAFVGAAVALIAWDVFDGWAVTASASPDGTASAGAVVVW